MSAVCTCNNGANTAARNVFFLPVNTSRCINQTVTSQTTITTRSADVQTPSKMKRAIWGEHEKHCLFLLLLISFLLFSYSFSFLSFLSPFSFIFSFLLFSFPSSTFSFAFVPPRPHSRFWFAEYCTFKGWTLNSGHWVSVLYGIQSRKRSVAQLK